MEGRIRIRTGDAAIAAIDLPTRHPVQTLNSRSITVRECMAIDMVDLDPCIGLKRHADGSALRAGATQHATTEADETLG